MHLTGAPLASGIPLAVCPAVCVPFVAVYLARRPDSRASYHRKLRYVYTRALFRALDAARIMARPRVEREKTCAFRVERGYIFVTHATAQGFPRPAGIRPTRRAFYIELHSLFCLDHLIWRDYLFQLKTD